MNDGDRMKRAPMGEGKREGQPSREAYTPGLTLFEGAQTPWPFSHWMSGASKRLIFHRTSRALKRLLRGRTGAPPIDQGFCEKRRRQGRRRK
jgi:hypothetical protein